MARKPTSGSAIERSIAQSTRFELTIAELARRSERRAWWVAWTAVALALALSGGYYFMLPLKQRVPYLVMADAYTGTATVARLDGELTIKRLSRTARLLRLLPRNPAYAPIDVEAGQDFAIEGVFCGLVRRG